MIPFRNYDFAIFVQYLQTSFVIHFFHFILFVISKSKQPLHRKVNLRKYHILTLKCTVLDSSDLDTYSIAIFLNISLIKRGCMNNIFTDYDKIRKMLWKI